MVVSGGNRVDIDVSSGSGSDTFEVTLTEDGSPRSYRVTVPEDLYKRLTGAKISKADCVKASFRFLLDRESKESIMSSFGLDVISRYFPEYEEKFADYI